MSCPNKESLEFLELQKLHWTLSQFSLSEIPIPEKKNLKEILKSIEEADENGSFVVIESDA